MTVFLVSRNFLIESEFVDVNSMQYFYRTEGIEYFEIIGRHRHESDGTPLYRVKHSSGLVQEAWMTKEGIDALSGKSRVLWHVPPYMR